MHTYYLLFLGGNMPRWKTNDFSSGFILVLGYWTISFILSFFLCISSCKRHFESDTSPLDSVSCPIFFSVLHKKVCFIKNNLYNRENHYTYQHLATASSKLYIDCSYYGTIPGGVHLSTAALQEDTNTFSSDPFFASAFTSALCKGNSITLFIKTIQGIVP